jgi:hypothetical protein
VLSFIQNLNMAASLMPANINYLVSAALLVGIVIAIAVLSGDADGGPRLSFSLGAGALFGIVLHNARGSAFFATRAISSTHATLTD